MPVHEARILVVDDERNVLMSLQAILQEDGYRVDTAERSVLAVEAIRKNHYDLVLTDLKMPGIDGLELLAEVRKFSPTTVTIMMTGYGSVDTAIDAVRLGAYEYLLKPMEVVDLKHAVRRSLERKRLSEVDTLYQLSSTVSASFDREKIRQEIQEAACRVLRLRHAEIIELTEPTDADAISAMLASPLVRAVLEQGMSITDQDASEGFHSWADSQGISSFALVPGVANGQLVCVLLVHNGDERYEFHASVIRFLHALSAQSALALSNATLFERVQQKNLELESANRKLQELDRLRSQFLSIASHELRTPLTLIMGYNSMLADSLTTRVTAEEKEILHESVVACQRLIRMVSSMLDLTQIDSGKLRIDFVSTDLVSLLNTTVGLFQTEAASRGIHLNLEVPVQLPRLLVDGDRLEQVITNLIGNSLKFTGEGGRIHVSLRYEADAGTVSISVSDTGIGIALEEQELIFNEFAQMERQAAKRHREGTGLGLAISRRIVEAHSGTISVRSAPGEGSTFTVVLPARRPLASSTSSKPA
jgi:signal transduction histidine kinase/CheY-like chemotaxis protein